MRQMGDHHEMGFGGRQPRHCSETSEGGDAKPETAKLSVFSELDSALASPNVCKRQNIQIVRNCVYDVTCYTTS